MASALGRLVHSGWIIGIVAVLAYELVLPLAARSDFFIDLAAAK
jgi:hypothetical protein